MNTTATANLYHVPSSDVYDPDEVVPKNSPLLKPTRLNLRISESPPPSRPVAQVSPPSSPDCAKSNRRRKKAQPSQGDAVLVSFLDGGRHPEIAAAAGLYTLPSDSSESEQRSVSEDWDREDDYDKMEVEHGAPSLERQAGHFGQVPDQTMLATQASPAGSSSDELKSLAANALGVLTIATENDTSSRLAVPVGSPLDREPQTQRQSSSHVEPAHKDGLPFRGERPSHSDYPPDPYGASNANQIHRLDQLLAHRFDPRSPPVGLPNGHGELPPIQNTSPRPESANPLPSIREQFGGDYGKLTEHLSDTRHGQASAALPRIPSMYPSSSPVSPNDPYGNPSPGHLGRSPSHNTQANGHPHLGADLHIGVIDVHGSDHIPSPAEAGVMLAGIPSFLANHPLGNYVCTFEGCTAAPFHTQYLLNSHANVHSSVRPHYCPVKGCPRSEGGKGFKRKNEMIRHGLVHESPGYVCPFCPDREHRYPRPDNLQRHVRVHHMDKDKDDPLLREVLAQRPDGPNRGRRRRGGQP